MSHLEDLPSQPEVPTPSDDPGVVLQAPSVVPEGSPQPRAPVDVGALRHPYEGSRFAIALVASALSVAFGVLVLVMIGQQSEIALIVLLLVASLAAAWVLIQLWRIRLLADAVLVGPQTLPEVQAAVDTVRERLDFHGRLPVFVVDRIGRVMTGEAAAVTLTSFFGVNVLVAEGGALGDLSDEDDRERLVFVLATYFGAVKARTAQWTPFLYALQFTFLPKLVFPFVYPWMRATVYTGDRIAYACCGNLNIGLEACYRALVGKEVAGHIQPSGLTGQALTVRSRFLLRLTQLLRPVPHVTNRYLDLLSFAAVYEPAAYERFRGSLDPSVAAVDGVLHRLQKRRPSPVAIPVGVALSALLLVGGVVVALMLRAPDSGGQATPSNLPTPAPDSSGNGVDTPSPEPVPVSNIAELTAVVAPPATPIGQDAAGNPVNYGAANLTDGDASSAWRMRGDGTGQVITFMFNQPVTLTAVGLVNGYAKTDDFDGTDRYAQERRITAVSWSFDGSRAGMQQLKDGYRGVQRVDFRDVVARTLALRIESTTPPGDPRFDYTAIGEVVLVGRT